MGSRSLIVATAAAVLAVAALATAVVAVRDHGSGSTSASSCNATTVADRAMASVVTVFAYNAAGAAAGSGSGEFITSSGYILTNDHVVSPAAGGSVKIQRVTGETLDATVVGRDVATDLAVLKVSGSRFPAIGFDTDDSLRIGQQVFAIGAPLGLSDSMSAGVVSGLNRTIRVPADEGSALIVSGIQTDASINPGNSGGTLANCAGRLVGVPTAGATAPDSRGEPVAGSIGIGFAIPAATAKDVADELMRNGKVAHPTLGVGVVPVEGSSGDRGLAVNLVVAGGPAQQAGLRQGDVLLAIDGHRVTSADAFEALLRTKSPGDTVTVQFVRADAKKSVRATLATAGG